MTRDNQGIVSPEALVRQQIDHDAWERGRDRVHNILLQGAKGLGVLNGGAAVAMLAFVQALIGKAPLPLFKPYAIASLVAFLVGSCLAAFVFFFQYSILNKPNQEATRKNMLAGAIWWFLVASAILALLGGGIVTIGICVAIR